MPPDMGERARWRANPFVTLNAPNGLSKPKDKPMVSPTEIPTGDEDSAGQDPILPHSVADDPNLSITDASVEAARNCLFCNGSGLAVALDGSTARCPHHAYTVVRAPKRKARKPRRKRK